MRISRLEIFSYELSFAHGVYVMSGNRTVTELESTVVRVVTDTGLDGFAEVCPLGSTYLPSFAAGAQAALREIAPAVVGGDPTNISQINIAMDQALAGHAYAKAPIDIACWDLLGKAAGIPVAALLGGSVQDSFPLYVAIPMGDPAEMAAFASARRQEGIRAFQLKVGGDPAADLARVQAVFEVTEQGDIVIADANRRWRLQDALTAARALESFGGRVYLEQPCETLDECLHVRAATRTPMILDEVISAPWDIVRAMFSHGMEAFNLKLSKFGGLTGAKLARDLAHRLGLRVTIEDTWGGDLTTAAVSHLAASTSPDTFLTASFMNDWTREHICGYRPRSERGRGSAPSGPGLGVEVDLDRLGEPVFTVAG